MGQLRGCGPFLEWEEEEGGGRGIHIQVLIFFLIVTTMGGGGLTRFFPKTTCPRTTQLK